MKRIKTVKETMICAIYRKRSGKVLATAELMEIVRNYLSTIATATTRGIGRRKLLQYLCARDSEARAKASVRAKLERLHEAIRNGEVSGYQVDEAHTVYLVRDNGENRCIVRTVEKPHTRVDWAAFARAMGYTEDHARCMGCITHYKGSDSIKEVGKGVSEEFLKQTIQNLEREGKLYPMIENHVELLITNAVNAEE